MAYSKLKKFSIIIIFFFILFWFNSISYGVEYSISESYMYDTYNARACAFILRYNERATQEQKTQLANLYTSGTYFPYLTVRNSNSSGSDSGWLGASDYPDTCVTYNHLALYLIEYDGLTSEHYGTGYMSFPNSSVRRYTTNKTNYNVNVYTSGTVGNANQNSGSLTIVCSRNLFGYHSPFLDDYFNGIRYGNSAQISSTLESANQHLNNIEKSLTATTPSTESQNITNDLQNTNNNTSADNINTSFFSSITSLFSNIANYNLSDNRSVTIPLPHSEQGITINGNYLYNNLPVGFKALIYSFWYFIFGFYAFKFINKIYISVKSGNILDGFKSNNEVITNDML